MRRPFDTMKTFSGALFRPPVCFRSHMTGPFASARVVLALLLTVIVAGAPAAVDLNAQDVDALIDEMTLEEKVGQRTQLTIQSVSRTRGEPGAEYEVDVDKLREALVDRHVGSLLNVWDMAMTVEQWTDLSGEIERLTSDESRLGIPILYGIDAVHGNNYLMEATIFPQNIGLAATWDLNLAAQAARITALESRAVGHSWNFAPVLDVGRTPLWSRFFETFGEDTFAASEFGRTTVSAMQEPGPNGYPAIAATGKHFVGYSMPLSGKDRTPAWIPERMLREIFLPPFQAAMVIWSISSRAVITRSPMRQRRRLSTSGASCAPPISSRSAPEQK